MDALAMTVLSRSKKAASAMGTTLPVSPGSALGAGPGPGAGVSVTVRTAAGPAVRAGPGPGRAISAARPGDQDGLHLGLGLGGHEEEDLVAGGEHRVAAGDHDPAV